ncbi:damage-inducible protein DinB, partial [Mesorhizobium sp. M00.F.Ca.ET.158.01.1.1]
MNLLDHLRRMAGNNLWSNDRLYRAVLALKPGEFEAERTSFFPSVKATLNHVLAVDYLYLDFREEGGVGAAAHDDFVPFD